MQDKIYCGMLNSYYGQLLTDHQREVMRLYYDCDMSLAEISELMGISRQAVREILVRSTTKLTEWDKKLGLINKVRQISVQLESIISGVDCESVAEIKKRLTGLLENIKEI